MTVNEQLILEIDQLHPAFMIRSDLRKIRVVQRSNDEITPIQEISINKAGRIKSMLHMNPGWIAHPPGNIPRPEIDRITEFKHKDSNNLESETRDIKTNNLLRQEAYTFEFNRLKTKTQTIIFSDLSENIYSEGNYHYDKNGLLVRIETQVSKDSNVLSESVTALDRDLNGLIRMKKISTPSENGNLEPITATTYNYDAKNRLRNAITSEQRMIVTREYQYEHKGYPQNVSLITERHLSGVTRTIENEFNDLGDRLKTTISDENVRTTTEYEYEYTT